LTRWTERQVLEAAPDQSSVAAARRLARPGPWSETGSTDTLVWGRCQGSGKNPYQVSVDLTGPAYRCSCPSRKFPCKHALALLLLWVHGDGAVETDAAADFAREWAEQRATSAADKAVRDAGRTSAPADPGAQERRRQARLSLMDAGMEDFRTWLEDLVRGGTAAARHRGYTYWDTAAARLVDAQLPGLATEVRLMGSDVHARPDWAEHLLARLGRWWTAAQAWGRRRELDPTTLADLRVVLGWPVPTEEVRADRGSVISGRWSVLGAHRTDDGRLLSQRTWLASEDDGRLVQVLDFAAGGQPLPVARLTGSVLQGDLALYPGSGTRRALFDGEPVAAGQLADLPGGGTLEDALRTFADLLAVNPWVLRAPVVLRSVGATVDGACVPTTDGGSVLLPWADGTPWTLLALTGGTDADLFGEFEGGRLRPLSTAVEGEVVGL
jgi:hypothetical protein